MKKLIGLFLAVVMLCMAFPSTVFASAQTLRSYTDLGEFVYIDPELGVECRANARWAINRAVIVVQMTAPKSDVKRMLRTESKIVVYWAHGHGYGSSTHNTKPVAADRFGGGFMTKSVGALLGPIGRGRIDFANYITTEIRFYADDVLVCECTFDKMAYAGLYND